MTRSEIARETGIGIEAVRFYERRALLPAPGRSPAGYRLYTERHARRLRFIKRARALGFSLEEIRDLLALRLDGRTNRKAMRRRVERWLALLDEREGALRLLRASLEGRAAVLRVFPERNGATS